MLQVREGDEWAAGIITLRLSILCEKAEIWEMIILIKPAWD
jgi:hypothetical protein